jgi:hypothetical protein
MTLLLFSIVQTGYAELEKDPGRIDDVRIYDRALTQTEIQSVMN